MHTNSSILRYQLLILFLLIISPTSSHAISPNKIIITLPETIKENFFVQLYYFDGKRRSMKGASKIYQNKEKGAFTEIVPTYENDIYISNNQLHKTTYFRIIMTDSQTYKEYKTIESTILNEKTLHITTSEASKNTWEPIYLSKEITVSWLEDNPRVFKILCQFNLS